jgi:ABC-type antimicrobial peptide transport system permease subunit
VRAISREMSSEQVIFGEQTMDSLISQSLARRQFSMILLLVFAGLALLLASIGVYGVISYVVAQRSAEIGLRIALGARPIDVFHLILGGGGKLAAVGICAGVAGALALTRLMSSVLYGISATDPATFVIVAVVFMLVALTACYVPARRASKVDPSTALRYE